MDQQIFFTSWLFLLLYKVSVKPILLTPGICGDSYWKIKMIIRGIAVRGNDGLKNVRLKVDQAVKSGESLRLECDYDLENAPLYSIKWYFGNDEFYRFVPKESPPTRVFPQAGVSVDLSKSDNRVVILRNVQRDQTGFYACEISADAPLFHTDIRRALIIVVECPKEPPKIFTEKIKFSPNEIIKATCSSAKSYPAANLTWYINGQMVYEDQSKKITSWVIPEADSLESRKSILEITNPSIKGVFSDGKLKLSCEATLFSTYRKSTDIEMVDDTPQLAHVLSPTPSLANFHSDSSIAIVIFLSVFVLPRINR